MFLVTPNFAVVNSWIHPDQCVEERQTLTTAKMLETVQDRM